MKFYRLDEEDGGGGGDAGGGGSVSGNNVANFVTPLSLGSKFKRKKDKKQNQPKITLVKFLRRNGWNTL